MAQLTGSTTHTSEKASEVRCRAINASEVAREGGENIRAATRSMKQIRDESLRIIGILEPIDGIAFQINILSLNASVEAARAGIHGKGFAVMASEVRTLALRCEGAAKDIRQLIATSVERTRQGGDLRLPFWLRGGTIIWFWSEIRLRFPAQISPMPWQFWRQQKPVFSLSVRPC